MKTTTTKALPYNTAQTALERAARLWLIKQAANYPDNGISGIAKDLFRGGCESGIVSHLISTRDSERFARKYIGDILALWQDDAEDQGGELPMPRNGADLDLNWLAWYGFETATRRVLDRATAAAVGDVL